MKKQTKKKGNPNFLSFLVDPAKGLFSPMIAGFPKALASTATDLFGKDPSLDEYNKMRELVGDGIPPSKPIEKMTLAELNAWIDMWSWEQSGAFKTAWFTNIIASVATLGFAEEAITMSLSDPVIKAAMSDATTFFSSERLTGILPQYERIWRAKYTPLLPEAYRLADMAAKELIDTARYDKAMQENGLHLDWAHAWRELMYVFPDVNTSLTMLRRGVINDARFKKFLRRQGYGMAEAGEVLRLKDEFVPPEVMAIAMQKEWITEDQYNEVMTRYGLNAEEAKWLYWTNEKIPDLNTLYNLKWRGLIDDNIFDIVMKDAMFPGWLVKPLKEMATVIPPLPDLITMAVREAFGKHTYEEQMPALVEWGGKMGLSKDWVENYWYAHWDRIPLREMYANLWRGYWNKDAFMRMLRIKDVHPDDREAIYNVAFLPPSIREMGYGYDMGVYDRADIVRYRKWGGMSPPDAEKAADSLIRYRVSAEIEAVRREWLWSYAHGRIDAPTYLQALIDLDTPQEAMQYWWDRAELQRERFLKPTPLDEGRIISSTEAKWAFKNGIRDEGWLIDQLKFLDWTTSRIKLTIERLKMEMAEKEKPPTPPIRAISLSDLRRAFRYEIINEASFRQEFENRGYTTEDINIIVTLELYHRPVPPPVKIPEITFSQLAGIFRRGIITESEFRSELAEREYVTEDIERLVTLEILKGIAPSPEITYRNLTATQIRNLYRFGKLSETDIPLAFQKIGYTEKDASMLSQILIAGEVTVETPRQLSRTDVARFYDMGIYSITQVYNAYLQMGYTNEDSQGLALYTAVNIEFPDLRAMYKNGWISADIMYNELVNIGLDPSRASELMMTVVKADQPERLATERDLTKSEIIKGVKVGIITPLQAHDMLMDMGYDGAEAWYILAINKVVEAGDPEGYWDMRRVTESLKKARGLPSIDIPEEALMLEKAIKEKKLELANLKAEEAKETDIATATNSLASLERSMAILITEKHLS